MDDLRQKHPLGDWLRHDESCAAQCAGNDDHGSHRVDGKACTCGLDEALLAQAGPAS